MKITHYRELTRDELINKHEQLWTDLFGMRIKHALGQLENPLQLRTTRRDIARVKTLLRQQGIVRIERPKRRPTAAPAPAAKAPKAPKAPKVAKAPKASRKTSAKAGAKSGSRAGGKSAAAREEAK